VPCACSLVDESQPHVFRSGHRREGLPQAGRPAYRLASASGSTVAFPTIEGNALHADELLRGEDFDLVFSNSLIEHLGGHGPEADSPRWSHGWRPHIWFRPHIDISP
jgi:hypothetical protein